MKLHLELSNRCVLECPACPRTWFRETLKQPVPKNDLDIDLLEPFLDCDSGQLVDRFLLESNHGDPIYAPQLLSFMKHWRSSKYFDIVTNGSHQKTRFWLELKELLTDRDSVTFSIDGLEDTNHLYRKNSDWTSIMHGLDILSRSTANITWKTIVFKHNENQLEQIERRAKELGCKFQIVNSNRFGKTELVPDKKYIKWDRLYENKKNSEFIKPECDSGSMLYIDANGYCWPCCWISSYPNLFKTELWQNKDKWNIVNLNLDQIMSENMLWVNKILSDPTESHVVCKMMCGVVDQKSFVC